MAIPFTVAYDGIGKLVVSFASALTRGTDEGKVVKVSANKTVALCSAEDKFVGVVETIDASDAVAGVQVGGFKTVSYSGTAPSAGYVELVADGSGGVKTPATAGTGIYYWVADVDTTNTRLTLKLG